MSAARYDPRGLVFRTPAAPGIPSRSALMAVMATILLGTGCGPSPSRPDPQTAGAAELPSVSGTPAPDTSATEYVVVGRIVSIPPNRRFVVVDHGPIEGFMDAMSMPFAVADTAAFDLSVGDSVRFLIRVGAGLAQAYAFERR